MRPSTNSGDSGSSRQPNKTELGRKDLGQETCVPARARRRSEVPSLREHGQEPTEASEELAWAGAGRRGLPPRSPSPLAAWPLCFSATLNALPSRTANFCTPEMPAPARSWVPASRPEVSSRVALSLGAQWSLPTPHPPAPVALPCSWGGGGLASYRVRWRPRPMGSVSDLVGLRGSCRLMCCRGPASRWLAGCGGRSGRGKVGVTPCTASRSPGRSRSQPRGLSTLAPDFGTRGQYET